MNIQVTPKIRPHLKIINGQIKTTSLKIAEHFANVTTTFFKKSKTWIARQNLAPAILRWLNIPMSKAKNAPATKSPATASLSWH